MTDRVSILELPSLVSINSLKFFSSMKVDAIPAAIQISALKNSIGMMLRTVATK